MAKRQEYRARISLKLKTYLGFEKFTRGQVHEETITFPDGATAKFLVENLNEITGDFVESVTWHQPNTPEYFTDRLKPSEHSSVWCWRMRNTTYLLYVNILPEESDGLPEGFTTRMTRDEMTDKFYIRDNNGNDYLRYNPEYTDRPPRQPLAVVFEDAVTAYAYLDKVCENPNMYSVVSWLEDCPVRIGWLISFLSTQPV